MCRADTELTRRRAQYGAVDSVKIEAELKIPAGRHALPPEEVARLQRERLIRATIACSAARGYLATTLADIVALAETSRSAFYEHFESKEACFLAAYEQMAASLLESEVASGRDAETWQEALDLGLATYFEWFAARPEVAAAFLVEIRTVGPAALAARAKVLERVTHRLRLLGKRARREQPELPELPDIAYSSIVLTADELAHDYVRRGDTARLAELIAPVQQLGRLVFEGGAGQQVR
jgi:AcrR family transcriptional regulator